jgi:polyhydroxybutyrate depolymerase
MKLQNTLLAIPIFLGVAAVSGYMIGGRPDDPREQIRVDGHQRSYDIHVPADYDPTKPLPLVLALHGRLGTGSSEERLAHFDKVSDDNGFLAVYPNGLDRSWADGRGGSGSPSDRNNIDDVKFLSALIDKIKSEYNIDATRIYAIGMSNGGFMSARLACELSDRIAAVAIVGASLSENVAANCHPAKPISVMIIQGTSDPIVPLAGGALGKDTAGRILSHDASVQKFAELDHCNAEPRKHQIPDTAKDGTTVDVTAYESCANGTEVRGYVVNGGGHTWPGGVQYLPAAFIGKTTHNLDGSSAIWKFLSTHQLH